MLETDQKSVRHNLDGSAIALETTNSLANAARATIYARVAFVSKNPSNGIGEQIASCRKFIKGKGWTTFHVYHDEGESGRTLDRPGLQSMLEKAKSGCFDIIVVYELNRLSRSLEHLVNIEKMLNQHSVTLCSVTEYQAKTQLPDDLVLNLLDFNHLTEPSTRKSN